MIKLDNISFDHCIKCTVCTIYCPVARGTHLFPGPKQSGPDAERLRIKNPELVDASLKYCSNCKKCEIACPSDVKIADIIQMAKFNYTKKRFSLRGVILSRLDLIGWFATKLSFAVNFIMALSITGFLMEIFIGISGKRQFPRFEQGTFVKWFRKHAPDQSRFEEQIVYFHGCSINNMDHSLGRDFVKVMNSVGTGVIIPKQKCCGVPAIANSELNKARKNANYNIRSLSENTIKDLKIIQTCSSGSFALKHEYRNLLAINNSQIYNRIEYVTRYLFTLFSNGRKPLMKNLPLRVAYHSPCHLERMGEVMHTIEVLKSIPGLDLVILNSECCGLSGTYGFKKEYYAISANIGKNLFKLLDDVNPEIVVTDCVTCKWQIEHFTNYRVVHPVNLLAMAIVKPD